MAKRTLKNLNLLDDFLFGTLVSHKEFGEAFCRELLYDLEAENAKNRKKRQHLPKRARFYRAIVDGYSLASGEDYGTLKDIYIIIILPYDPFDRDRIIYTIRNMCEEDPSMPYEDGARTIFLYTKGTKGNISKELRELLHYMEDTEEKNAVNSSLQKIQKMVEKVKEDKGVFLEYMKIWEQEQMIREEGMEAGIAAGKKEGIALGKAEQEKETEKERRRAEKAEKEVEELRKKLLKLQK